MVVDNQRKDTTKIKILISKLPFFFLKCFSLRIEDYSMNTLNLNGSKEGTVRFVNVYDQKSSPGSRFLPPKWVWWLVFACPCVENWNLLPLRGKFAWHGGSVFWLRIGLRTFFYLTIKHRVPWLALLGRSRNTGDNSKPKTISLCIQDDVNDKFSIFRSLRRLAKNKAIGNPRADKRLNLQRTLNKLEYTWKLLK